MTELQAEQIRKMRTQGVGYRAIASVVGLSRDIVRNYCRSHGMDGYASALTKNIQEQMMLGKACLYCGAELIQPSTGRSFAQISADGNGGKHTQKNCIGKTRQFIP